MNDTTDRLLALLRDSSTQISADEIGRCLSIPVDSVLPLIETLRESGLRIDFTPESGYALGQHPDLLFERVIFRFMKTESLGKRVVFRHEITSTNSLAMALGRDGEPHGTLVIADGQTMGRGRMDRGWESPAGVNIYMSIILRPSVSPVQASQLPVTAAVAVTRALERFEPTLEYRIKWPNDITVGGKKIAGILCEMRNDREKVQFVILGIGLNVNMTGFGPSISKTATSLKLEMEKTYFRPILAAYVIEEMEAVYSRWLDSGGLKPLMKHWADRCALTGRMVTLSIPEGDLTGTVVGLAESGALRIRTEDGIQDVYSGDAHLTRMDRQEI